MPNIKRIIILGSTGFIGRALFQHLKKSQTGQLIGFSSQQLNLTSQGGADQLRSYCDPQTAVIFLSSITRDRQNDPQSQEENLKMVLNVSHAIRESNLGQLIFTSSIDVYGPATDRTILKEETPLKPEKGYASYKAQAEKVLQQVTEGRLPLLILRLGGIYGPGDTHRSPIQTFIRLALANREVTIYGDGTQLRDYIFIEDLCAVLSDAVLQRAEGVVNVVSGHSVSVNDIVRLLEGFAGKKLLIRYEKGAGNAKSYRFDPALFNTKFPRCRLTDIQTGLERTYQFYASSVRP